MAETLNKNGFITETTEGKTAVSILSEARQLPVKVLRTVRAHSVVWCFYIPDDRYSHDTIRQFNLTNKK